MIIIRIHGGLGNQMFEYALAYALKKRYPQQKVKLDISDYHRFTAHTGYSLEKYFGIHEEIATKDEIRMVYPGAIYDKTYMNMPNAIKKISNMCEHLKTKTRKYQKFARGSVVTDYRYNVFNDVVFHIDEGRDVYFKGYWQNISYFDQYRDELRQLFTPIKEMPRNIIEELQLENTVSVHVRRGDYIGSSLDLCREDYYRAAIGRIEEMVCMPQYVFFTDDARFVEENFQWISNKKIIANSPEDCDVDMKLMSMCKHHIIANSSFSFWGAYLAEDDGIVIAPEKWMHVDVGYCGINMPQGWVIVKNG